MPGTKHLACAALWDGRENAGGRGAKKEGALGKRDGRAEGIESACQSHFLYDSEQTDFSTAAAVIRHFHSFFPSSSQKRCAIKESKFTDYINDGSIYFPPFRIISSSAVFVAKM